MMEGGRGAPAPWLRRPIRVRALPALPLRSPPIATRRPEQDIVKKYPFARMPSWGFTDSQFYMHVGSRDSQRQFAFGTDEVRLRAASCRPGFLTAATSWAVVAQGKEMNNLVNTYVKRIMEQAKKKERL